jgi:hypothetical protein
MTMGSAEEHAQQWALHGLPERLNGRSFLEVGCWEGFSDDNPSNWWSPNEPSLMPTAAAAGNRGA